MDSTPKPAIWVAFWRGNHDFGPTIGKVVDGHGDNAFGIIKGMVFVELDVDDVVLFHLGDGMGGDQLGVKAFGNIGQVLENTLDIHDHGIAGAGDNGQFLLQESACGRNAVALKNLIGRTADAAELDAFGAFGFGIIDHFLGLGCGNDHFGENGFMAVDDDVDMIFFHDSQVGFGMQRIRGAEHDILKVGGDHGSTPAVCQSGSGCTA